MVLLSAFTTLKMAPFVRLERIWFWSSTYFNRNTKTLPINFTSLIWSCDPWVFSWPQKFLWYCQQNGDDITIQHYLKTRLIYESFSFISPTALEVGGWPVLSVISAQHTDCLSKSHLRMDRRCDGGLFLYQNLSEERSQKPFWNYKTIQRVQFNSKLYWKN